MIVINKNHWISPKNGDDTELDSVEMVEFMSWERFVELCLAEYEQLFQVEPDDVFMFGAGVMVQYQDDENYYEDYLELVSEEV